MGKNNKKILTKIGVGLGSTALAVGGISSVLTSCAHTGSKYIYTWDNVYSIQKSFLKFYLYRLNKEGFSSNEIEQKMQQASNDIDTIIRNGKQSGLSHDESIQLTYADLWNYSKAKQVDPFDWKMFDDVVVKFRNQLHDTIYSSSLPNEQKDTTWQKYNSAISDEVALIKSKANSSTEAIEMFKGFGENFARQELKDQKTKLVNYYLANFFHQHPLKASNLYYDTIGFGKLKKGDVLPYGWFQSPNTNYDDSNKDDTDELNGNTTMLSSLCIDASCINRFYNLDTKIENYTFQCLFSRYDDQLHKLYYRGKIIDNNNPSISATTDEEQCVTLKASPAKHHSLMVESLQQHSFNFESPKITMLDWVDILKTISPSSQQKNAQSNDPLMVDMNLDKSSHMFYIDNKCLGDTSDTDIRALKDAFQLDLYVYAYDANANTVTYSVEARSNDQGYTDETPYVLFPKKTVVFSSGIDQAAINNLKQTFSTLNSIQISNTQKIESNMNRLYILNTALACEQIVMAGVCTFFAAMYFSTAVFTALTTVKMGVMSTIGAVGCLVGAALSTVSAVEYKKKYDQIKQIRAQKNYAAFEAQFNNFKNSADGKFLASSRFGTDIGIATYMSTVKTLQTIAALYSKTYTYVQYKSLDGMSSFDESSWEEHETGVFFHNLADAYAPAATRADFARFFHSMYDGPEDPGAWRSFQVLVNTGLSLNISDSLWDTMTREQFIFMMNRLFEHVEDFGIGDCFKSSMNLNELKQALTMIYDEVLPNGLYTAAEHGMLFKDIWGQALEAIVNRCINGSIYLPKTSAYASVENLANFIYTNLTNKGISWILTKQQDTCIMWSRTIGALRSSLLKMSRGETDVPGVSVEVVDDQRLFRNPNWVGDDEEAAKAGWLDGLPAQTVDFKRIVFHGDDAEQVRNAANLFFSKLSTPVDLGMGAIIPPGGDGAVTLTQSGVVQRVINGHPVAGRASNTRLSIRGQATHTNKTLEQVASDDLQAVTDRLHLSPKEINGVWRLDVAITEASEAEKTTTGTDLFGPFVGEAIVKTRNVETDAEEIDKITAIHYSSDIFNSMKDAALFGSRMAQRVVGAGDVALEGVNESLGGGRFLVDGVIMTGFRGWRAMMLANLTGQEEFTAFQQAMIDDVPPLEGVIGLGDLVINIIVITLQSVWG